MLARMGSAVCVAVDLCIHENRTEVTLLKKLMGCWLKDMKLIVEAVSAILRTVVW